MTNGESKFSKQFLKIISKSVERRIYGSVEIYFENGQITQITQRIINKVGHRSKFPKTFKTEHSSKEETPTQI